jgi:hypothetical protein
VQKKNHTQHHSTKLIVNFAYILNYNSTNRMTTQPCEICMEDKLLSQHTFCPNGHLGGCQKCHMNLVKSLYETSTTGKVFDGDTTAQKCMFCRASMWDRVMGENWSLKLSKLQPILCYNMMVRLYGHSGNGREAVVEGYNGYVSPEAEDYKFIDGAFIYHDENIKELCKSLGKNTKLWKFCLTLENYTKETHEKNKAMAVEWKEKREKKEENGTEWDSDSDDEMEVEEITYKGIKFYYNAETRVMYNQDTSEAVGNLPIDAEYTTTI